MIAKAEGRFLRLSPFKARKVIALVRKYDANKAMIVLSMMPQKGAFVINKIVKSAVANAKSKGYDENKLVISKMIANPGPMLKRFRAASFGRAVPILKRLSHILVELDSSEKIVPGVKSASKKAPAAKKVKKTTKIKELPNNKNAEPKNPLKKPAKKKKVK